jgi:anthraniloyl-CoA monooxygenase
MYSMLTRSQRISHENLRLRDAQMAGRLRALVCAAGRRRPCPQMQGRTAAAHVHALHRARADAEEPRRRLADGAVQAVDGVVGDYHLVHLGARAMGGAALVMAEMTCVRPDGRITPGCPALWNDAQARPGSAS